MAAENRRLHITKEAFSKLCQHFYVPSYFVETIVSKKQLGRMAFGSYLQPGEDGAPEVLGSFRLLLGLHRILISRYRNLLPLHGMAWGGYPESQQRTPLRIHALQHSHRFFVHTLRSAPSQVYEPLGRAGRQ